MYFFYVSVLVDDRIVSYVLIEICNSSTRD